MSISLLSKDALSYVAGYATGNDFSARDLQVETGGQWMVGKTSDGTTSSGDLRLAVVCHWR